MGTGLLGWDGGGICGADSPARSAGCPDPDTDGAWVDPWARVLLGRAEPPRGDSGVDVEYVGGGGVGAALGGRKPGGSRSGGIVGVEPGGNGRSGQGNGDNVRVLVLVDGRVGGNSVVAHAGGSFQPVCGTGCCVGTGGTTVGSTGSAGIRVMG